MMNNNRLFRAIRSDNGEWVYGSVIDQGPGKSYMIQNNLSNPIPIIWDTIGQFVPKLDAYDGDILFGSDNHTIWQGIVTYIPEQSRIMVVTAGLHHYEVDAFRYDSIAGNIHQHEQHFRREFISVEMVKYIMANRNVIISHETAALLLGLATPKKQSTLHCYTNADYKIPGVICHNVDSFDDIHHLSVLGLRMTNYNQTIRDLLTESTDPEILLSSLSNYQDKHPTHFADMINNLPQSLKDKYNEIKYHIDIE